MDNGHQVDVVYTDYSKAFDKISHNLLIQKLEYIGIHGDLLRWLESYLRERSQAVTVKGYCSSFMPVTSGVPQGSHLGPLLFNLYINDVFNIFKHSKFILYADDKKIYRTITKPEDCLELQNDINNLCDYCKQNCLFLNVKKCNTITFSRKSNSIKYNYKINNDHINRVTGVRDLGVQLDSKLIFDSQITTMTNKAFRMLGFVLRVGKDFKHKSTLILLYKTLVRPILEYASAAWNPQYAVYIEQIQKLQNKFTKHLNWRFNFGTDYTPRLQKLEERRAERDLVYLYKIIRGQLDSPYLLSKISFGCPRLNARKRTLFQIGFSRTNYGKNTFIKRACRLYNDTISLKANQDLDIFHLSLPKFKFSIRNILASKFK